MHGELTEVYIKVSFRRRSHQQRSMKPSQSSCVSGDASHGEERSHGLRLLDLHTERALDSGLGSGCFRGGLDRIVTQL